MSYNIREVQDTDSAHIVSIMNHFILNGYAAYMEKEAGPELFDLFRNGARAFYVLEKDRMPVGFGLLRPYLPFETFRHTCTMTYFILPDYTRRGWGTKLTELLIIRARQGKIENLLVHVSSRNEQSLQFHRKLGFRECGRLVRAGLKFGKYFDVVWMQKFLD